jgi:cytochrome c553
MNTTTKIALVGLSLSLAAGYGFAATVSDNWDNDCASCHGADGKGQTKQGKKLKLRDYTDAKVQAELKDDDMLKAILEGVKDGGKERMKAFKDELSADEAKELVAFVRKLKA